MTSNNYVTILGWMTNLDIKGNELIVYAVIHGFCQDKESYFHGSVKYLTEWTKTSEQCIIDILKHLVEKGLLEKIQRDGRTNLYRTINPFEETVVKTEEKETQNVDNEYKTEIETIISYLNNKLHSRYRFSNSTINKLISSKLKSGFTVDDFLQVIDKKYDDWYDNEELSKYLRPITLFGNKFENYLNQPVCNNHKSFVISVGTQTNLDYTAPISYNKSKVY